MGGNLPEAGNLLLRYLAHVLDRLTIPMLFDGDYTMILINDQVLLKVVIVDAISCVALRSAMHQDHITESVEMRRESEQLSTFRRDRKLPWDVI